jgi:amidase
MGNFAEFEQYDAMGLAELVKKKEVTPAELCKEAIDRIEQFNPEFNAVVTRMDEQGRKAASGPLPEGPFTGVPFLLKDLLADYAGVPTSYGNRVLKNIPAAHDSEMVVRFKKSGLVILGKTNTPEFGLTGVTEPEVFGPCRNPWNREHTPGGSSGGSGAAVAVGMVPMASAGDGGGSIRIPASCCGLFGIKPSRGRNPTGPDHGRIWQGAVQEHVISRSVRDSAAMLDMTNGADTGAPYEIRPPEGSYLKEVETEPAALTIAFNTRSPIGTPVHKECIAAVEETARILEHLGHYVEPAEPDIDGMALAKSYMTLYFGEVGADIREMADLLGRKATRADVEPLTWTLGMLGRSFSAAYFVEAMRQWDRAARKIGVFFKKYDLYLCPTMAVPPPRIGELNPSAVEAFAVKAVNALRLGGLLKLSGIVDQMAEKSLSKMPFTQMANLCGLPAMSVPLYWGAENLPIGVQFVGPFGDEATLFRLAGQLERAKPWFDIRP